MTATMFDDFAAAMAAQTAPLVDLLVLVNDCSPLLGGTLAAEIDTLVRGRLAVLVAGAADVAADRAINGAGVERVWNWDWDRPEGAVT